MLRYSAVVFDEFIDNGATASYTSVDHMAPLADGAQISVVAVCTQAASPSVSITVAVEHSADGRSFKPKTSGTIISAAALGTGLTVISGGEASPVQPSMKYVRLAVTLAGGVGIGAARVRIGATVRGSNPAAGSDREPAPPPPEVGSLAGTLARHARVIGELQHIAKEAMTLPPAYRARHFLGSITPEVKAHMVEVERHLRSLHPDARRFLTEHTATLVRTAFEVVGRRHAKEECCPPTVGTSEACACAPGSKK